MGMKLKSGADLCGFELSRFCVQNDVAIPDAPASGRKYFHTGTGMEGKYSLLGRERIYTGTAWRSAAYVDDLANLDLATNEDYLALKEKVELLSGEVDTDAIINNMKEVTAFLSGFAEDANLMSVLDGKLDKTGGTITGGFGALTIDRNNIYASAIKFSNSNGVLGYIGINDDYTPMIWSNDGTYTHTLIHSGNIGSQSVAEAKNLVGVFSSGFDANECYNTYGHLRLHNGFSPDSANIPDDYNWSNGLLEIALNGNGQVAQFYFAYSRPLYYRASNTGSWKQIAFTSSNVASATKLQTARTIWGQSFDGTGNVSGNIYLGTGTIRSSKSGTDRTLIDFGSAGDPYFGYGTSSAGIDTHICGNNIFLQYGTSRTNAFLINSSGNVTIGSNDLAGTDAKLYVDGKLYAGNYSSLLNGKRWIFGAGVITGEEKDFVFSDATSYAIHMLIDSETSSVGIGLRTPQAQLHVAKDILANGTVACKGVAAEGSAPVGTVDKWAGSIAIGTKSQTYTHGLVTTDITVAIYEKNGNEWVQILTDVDIVNANTIRVTFGANTTVEHRIVVMG